MGGDKPKLKPPVLPQSSKITKLKPYKNDSKRES